MAKRVVITGGNAGIGFEAARQLLALGHHVILACRDDGKAQRAVEALTPAARAGGGSVAAAPLPLDLASLASVRSAAAALLQVHPSLDVLLCNAGVMPYVGVRGGAAALRHTVDGQELTLQANHLGHFLLAHLLLPALLTSPAARVVLVSSELHRNATATANATANATATTRPAGDPPLASPQWLTRLRAAVPASGASSGGGGGGEGVAVQPSADPQSYGLTGMQLYGISKLYNLWFAYRLAALLPPSVVCNAVTPGWVPGTSLGRGAPWLARVVLQNLFPLLPFTVSVREGARRVVAVCVGQQEGSGGGRYYSRGLEAASSAESRDGAAAAELWRLSEAAAGVEQYLPAGTAQREEGQGQQGQEQREQLAP